MASFDLYNRLDVIQAIQPQEITATTTSNAIDTAGFEGVAFVFETGKSAAAATFLNAANTLTVSYLESDDTNVSNATNVDTDRIQSAPVLNNVNTTFFGGVTPAKRYVFARLTEAGTVNALVSGTAILGDAHNVPTQG